MAIGIIDRQELWDRFVDESPYGLLFHKWDFLKIIEKHSGYRLLTYGIYKGESLICVFPLFFKQINGLKTVFSPPPQTAVPYLGFVMDKEFDTLKQDRKESSLKTVASEADNEIRKISPGYVSVSLVPNFMDTRAFKWNGYKADAGYTYVIDLNNPLKDCWNRLTRDLRWALRKTEKLNLQLIKSRDIAPLYHQLQERYRIQKMKAPILSKDYLDDLLKAYPDHIGCYYLTDNAGEIVGSTATIEYKWFMSWIGMARVSDKLFANEYLTWKLIEKAKQDGHQKFELEGANTQKLCQFKTKFNPSLELYFHIYQKSALGKLAEWTYLNLIRRKLFYGTAMLKKEE